MSAPSRAGRPWTRRELLLALDWSAAGIDAAQVAATLHRTPCAVRCAVCKAGGPVVVARLVPDSLLHARDRGSARWLDLLAAAGERRSRQRGWRP